MAPDVQRQPKYNYSGTVIQVSLKLILSWIVNVSDVTRAVSTVTNAM